MAGYLKLLIVTGLLAFFATSSVAMMIHRRDVRDLISRSPLVVKGRITAIDAVPEAISAFPRFTSAPRVEGMRAKVNLEYIIKGELKGTDINVLFLHGDPEYSFTTLQVDNTYILFLTDSESDLKFNDPQNGAIQVLKGKANNIDGGPLEKIRAEFEQSLATQDTTIVRLALQGLASVGDARSLEKVKPYISSPDEAIRIRAVAAALALGEWRYAEPLVRFLEEHYRPGEGYWFTGGIGMSDIPWDDYLGAVTDKEAGPLFTKLFKQSKSPTIRISLMTALCSMHYEGVLSELVILLRDKDENISYFAYAAIMQIRGLPRSSSEKFERDKASIIPEIERWATSHTKDATEAGSSHFAN